MHKLLVLSTLLTIIASCTDDKVLVERKQVLADRLHGEWIIERIYLLDQDSSITDVGSFTFQSCDMSKNNKCPGVIDAYGEAISFSYTPIQWEGEAPDEITITPAEDDNKLYFRTGGYKIITLNDSLFVLDAPYCEEDTISGCSFINRHIEFKKKPL